MSAGRALDPLEHPSRREAEALERKAEVLRVLLEDLPIAVGIFDRQGVCVSYEGKGIELLGRTPEQILGKSFYDLYADPIVHQHMREALAGGRPRATVDFRGTHVDGAMSPIYDQQGEIAFVVTTMLISGEARRAEAELKQKVELVKHQVQIIHALSAPIIEVWDKVLTLPMLGVLDSARAADVMESLLVEISRKGARFAILDLTGVETVDMTTAAYLLKLIQSIRLLGAEGVITGIRPSVARTMVSLRLQFGKITTLGKLRDGLKFCMARLREGAA